MSRIRTERSRARAIREIETGLRSLSKGLKLLAGSVATPAGNGGSQGRRRVSTALRLQGRYMGLIRTLPTKKKARVMALRARKGVEQAIRLARDLRA